MASVAVAPPACAGAQADRVKFSVATLGCKVNRFESESIAQQLRARGHQRADLAKQRAEVCVINTCTVTAEADRQSRQLVRRAIRDNPGARVVVTGCYAEMNPQACAAIPGVDMVVGNARKLDIPALLDAPTDAPFVKSVNSVAEATAHADESAQSLLSGFDGRARAFLQIQQGCDQGCTFCIIHRARGPNRSVPARRILRQAEQLVRAGHRELVVCGVDIGSYGDDLAPDENLPALLARLTDIKGDFRVRLSSIDPAHLSDALIESLAHEPSLCPQLHLSLQSASTMILKRMKRRATREMVYERVAALRRALPELVLSADILVGFPTETEAQFDETLRALD
ncbi:MAG: tRNA (N(6)-L-threonylcarbamoyladenosine(37)-C(2))-methylthiotransferase MtaB, partial [bacterium]